MTWAYRHLVRPWLFSQESESIHNRTIDALAFAGRHRLLRECIESFYGAPPLPTTLFGLQFPNPVGLAAGMDKSARAVPAWLPLGFGFVELGGVTCHPQEGNPQPRMFRAIAEEALVNRMGFNNPGCESVARTLQEWRDLGCWPAHPVGINLGKSKITPLAEATSDYLASFSALRGLADFFVVNVSSPNTPNLRQLQDKAALEEILSALIAANQDGRAPRRPILVKIAPDLTFEACDDILDVALRMKLAGIVATNTTIARPDSSDPDCRRILQETGGLSGRPLGRQSTALIRHLHLRSQGRLPIIGVGGIFNAEDAWEKITAGASLVQIYTALVYEGPGVVSEIVEGLQARLEKAGMKSLPEAVGSGN